MKSFVPALCLTSILATSAGAAPRIDAVKGQVEWSEGDQTIAVKLGDDLKKLAKAHNQADNASSFALGAVQISGQKNVAHIAIDVKTAGGVQVGETTITADQALNAIAIPGCRAAEKALVCDGSLWMSSDANNVYAHLQTSSLAQLSGKWRATEMLQLGDGRPRPDLKVGASAAISADNIRFGDSRCAPKQENVARLTRSEWLAGLNLQSDAFAENPIVFDVATGCTDVLGHLYVVGDRLVVHRSGVLYVFARR